MDREHVKGAADKAKGAIKEAAGKVTGDRKLQTEGKIDKAKGVPAFTTVKGGAYFFLPGIKALSYLAALGG